MSVRDHCRRDPCTAKADETIREVAKRMDVRGVGCVVVVDESEKPIGMLTDRDIVMKVLRRRRDPDKVTVGEVMHRELSTAFELEPLERAIFRMHREGVRRIPVRGQGGKLCGILAIDDALQLLASELAGVAQAVRAQFPADLNPAHALPAGGTHR
jgi:CBS domain-containing protein